MRGMSTLPSLAAMVDRRVERGTVAYRRAEMLPRLLPVSPSELAEMGEKSSRRLCLRLLTALRRERTRGRAGHWSYDLNRHIGLLQAYRAERRRLEEDEGAGMQKSPALRTGLSEIV